METIEYTRQRFALVDKGPLSIVLAITFFGAGLIMLGFSFQKPDYLPFGIFLLLAGAALFFFSRESTFITLDREARILEIIRKPVLGKIRVERYEWNRIQDARATEKDPQSDRLRYRVEVNIDGKEWVPLTRPFQRDSVNFETLPGKILGFIKGE
jgi:hypothetical protein